MPKKIQNFAKSALVKPITINVGRAGAASLDVIQVCTFFIIISDTNSLHSVLSVHTEGRSCAANCSYVVSLGSGIRKRGSEDGVFARVSPENTSSRQCISPIVINTLQENIYAFVKCLFLFCEQVLIFAEKKADVDAIHEYLLLKGVEAVAIHGGKGTPLQSALSHTQPLSFL